ncbi:SusC/RagA family TonB-linked outer membrane protein [Sphingobacterium sp. FBM7-1]|uniref:SusC/RagA family TonB-linked outer membrane protein n=1 Tax=Sphingobacterium sp. FBM7-1 TaxID=2886688 RepID=UPI001D10678B|nr:TonB-dependent receptor [Sphingobacterium sp. FBM7-1]MCC2600708.1 TonB-dependent receptor [Sphingobacterium sp. FBM7-1]
MRKFKALLLMLFVIQCVFAQERTISGTVHDEDRIPMAGVTVKVKGMNQQTSTDDSGYFTIAIPNGGNVLVFSSIGYLEQEQNIQGNTKISVTMRADAAGLDEVVVIGYGSVRRKDLTGAVASVDAKTITAAPVSSALEAIQGRVAGLNINTTEGSPDAELTVRVRGGGSITQDNSPLYIVDGFPVSSIADIAPQDIESIDILKDASSTAIYGARGANGVILVTTKGGKTGKTAISFNVFTGSRNLANKLDVLSPLDYVTWQYEHSLLANKPENYTQYFGNYQDIDLYADVEPNDWQEIIFGRTGTTYNQNLNLSGGGEKTRFSVSHSFVKDRAIMQMSDFQRHNANFKLNHKLYDNLTLDIGARYSDTQVNGGGMNEQNEVSSADSRLKYAMLYPPFPVAGLTTTTETDDDFNLYSPIVAISDNDQYYRRKTVNLNAALSYQVLPNLRLRSEFGYDNYRNDQDRFYGATTYYVRNVPAADYQDKPGLILTNTSRNGWRNTNTATYTLDDMIGEDHKLNVMVGQEYLFTENQVLTNAIHNFPESFSFEDARKLTTQGVPNSVDNNFSPDDKLLSFFGRANYDFRGKYLLSATFRADGSSKFSQDNWWGYFPSISGAWRLSDEEFLSDAKTWLTDMKLRASYGTAGNNRIPSGLLVQTFNNSTTNWVNGYDNYWAASKTMANPDLKWETTVTRNIGLDFTLWNGRLSGTIDAYHNKTKDLLIAFPVAGTGYDVQYRNLGNTQNKGLEFTLNGGVVRKTNFDLSINANIAFNRNKVLSLGAIENIPGTSGWASTAIGTDYMVEVGAPIGQMYGYQSDGRYEVSDFERYDAGSNQWVLKEGVTDGRELVGLIRPGSMKIKDLDGDGKVSVADRTIIGNANPLHTGGFSITSRVYNFDFATYFTWSYGNDIYNANKIEYTSTSQYNSRNMIDAVASGSRWTNLRPDGTISNDPAELEAMNANTTMWSPYTRSFTFSDWAVEDGSFLRLSTATIGYTFPQSITSKLKMQNLRIYASGYNLLLFTDYSGFDPEVSTRRRTPLTPGVDYSAYPKSRSFVFGLNVNF